MTQGEGEERAGQKKEARGKAGASCLVVGEVTIVPLLLLVLDSGFRRLRGLCAEEGVGGIVSGGWTWSRYRCMACRPDGCWEVPIYSSSLTGKVQY